MRAMRLQRPLGTDAVALGGAAVGVILSGTGSDGALGLRQIKAGGGYALLQRLRSGELSKEDLLKSLDDMGIADNTIVIYTTDNGPHQNTWPDAGTTPFGRQQQSGGATAW